MTKEKFLTVRWNNLLSLGLGIPALIYVLAASSNSFWSTRGGLIGIALIGVLYWIIIEGHTAMRFAWLRENSANQVSIKQGCTHPLALIRVAYNAVFWIFLLPFFTSMEYGTGFIVFTVVVLIRLLLNLYTNHVLKQPEQYESFPFRIPWIVERLTWHQLRAIVSESQYIRDLRRRDLGDLQGVVLLAKKRLDQDDFDADIILQDLRGLKIVFTESAKTDMNQV